jgi:hypothetical protein
MDYQLFNILKWCLIVTFLIVGAFFLVIRQKIIAHLKKNHSDIYRSLFYILEDGSIELRDVWEWWRFTSKGYKMLKDNYLTMLMRQQNTLGKMTIVLLFLMVFMLIMQHKY